MSEERELKALDTSAVCDLTGSARRARHSRDRDGESSELVHEASSVTLPVAYDVDGRPVAITDAMESAPSYVLEYSFPTT